MARRTVLPSPVVPDLVWSIVVAGGSGQRFGGPKQFHELGGRPLVAWAVDAAQACSDGVVLVVPAGSERAVDGVQPDAVVEGGATRSESVRAGLAVVPPEAGVIVVHDAARPFASPALFARVIEAVREGADAAVPGIEVTDTVKVVDDAGLVVATPDRATLRAIQTPQAFAAGLLRAAHEEGATSTDDAALVERLGGHVRVVPGEPANRKITDPSDLEWARRRVAAGAVG
jgi:2-C-methyl-D-erythritol 4-phosphate cytidylyltransferase